MQLKNIQDAKELSGKKVLMRADFNVELDSSGQIGEHFKIDAAKATIEHLFELGVSRVALLSHFGRPDGKYDESFSLKQIVPAVERALGRKVRFVSDCVGHPVAYALASAASDEVLLLENVRFYPQEEANDSTFAKQLSASFDVFVNDAFSVCHRAHASVSAITEYIESYAGLRLIEEVAQLESLESNPKRPAVAVIGGAKIETKLPIIRNFEKIYDTVLVGGRIANEAIDQGLTFSNKVVLPKDFNGDARFDIGPLTSIAFSEVIKTAQTIVWNGPMGKFEEAPYDMGTKVILRAIADNKNAHVVIGGGESLTVLERENLLGSVGFVSTGGGAMLDFLGGVTMPGLEALRFVSVSVTE